MHVEIPIHSMVFVIVETKLIRTREHGKPQLSPLVRGSNYDILPYLRSRDSHGDRPTGNAKAFIEHQSELEQSISLFLQ